MNDRLRLREIDGNIAFTSNTATAWFLVAPQQWAFKADTRREDLINNFARALARLHGRHVHLRATARPYPAELWAKNLHADTPNPVGGRNGDIWKDHLRNVQQRLQTATLSDKEVYVGVELGSRSRVDSLVSRVGRTHNKDRHRLEQITARIAAVLAGPGVEARPATTRQLEWLLHRSVALGLPAPSKLSAANLDGWTEDDLYVFTDQVQVEHRRFGRTIKITGIHDGHQVTRHIAVLTMGRMDEIRIPESSGPWMQHTDRFPFPVELSSRFEVLGGQAAKASVNKHLLKIRDQIRSYRDHDMDVPPDLERKAEHAVDISDQMHDGDELTATRVHGWHRIAVAADTEEKALERAEDIRDSYRNLHMDVVHPIGQHALMREFIPGEPLADSRYPRHMEVRYMAAALPQVTANVGDNRGPYMGYTCGTSRRAFMLDPHHAAEVAEMSGLVPLVGGLGAGKSALLGNAAYESALRGINTTVLDPSGPLARLCDLPELEGHARHIDLLRSPAGTLNPYYVIPDPIRSHYPNDRDYEEAKVNAQHDRKELATDVARMLLPHAIAETKETRLAIASAIRDLGGSWQNNMHMLTMRLRDGGDPHGVEIAEYLNDMAEMPQARLFFGSVTQMPNVASLPTLLVLTMAGLTLPNPTVPPDRWSTAEQLAVPLLHLATHYTTRRIYGRPMRERKFVALDEVGQMSDWSSGRTLFQRLGRDSRKWNIAGWVSSQNPDDVLRLEVANFISAAFVGRIEDHETAAEALRLIRVETGVGYESVLANLSPRAPEGRRGAREFVVRDIHGNVDKVAIDLAHKPRLLEILDTTPKQTPITDPSPLHFTVEPGQMAEAAG